MQLLPIRHTLSVEAQFDPSRCNPQAMILAHSTVQMSHSVLHIENTRDLQTFPLRICQVGGRPAGCWCTSQRPPVKGSKFRITQQAHWKALDFQFVRSQQHSVVVGTQSMHMQLQWQSMVLMVRLVEAPALVIRWSLTTLSALISYSLEALCSNQTAVSTNICATVARCDTLCCSSSAATSTAGLSAVCRKSISKNLIHSSSNVLGAVLQS